MKRIGFILCALFVCTIAFANTINWHVENEFVQTTSCQTGENVIVPTPPEKYGYTFKEWKISKNLFDITALENSSCATIIDSDTFTVTGYPCVIGVLKELAPGLEEGDTIIFTEETNNSKTVYIGGLSKTWPYGKELILTSDILNRGIGIYRNPNTTASTIKNFQIIKVENTDE